MKEEGKQVLEVIGDPQKSIPKFATNVSFGKIKNGSIVMTFMTRVGNEGPAALIETIMVDREHALKIIEVLKRTIERPEQENKQI